ncbi:MAG: hypothetical protein HYU51_18795 [Candidatus Rokubacteria bacterium]|nr:hypothetical protein [Candidatus Rokubacteria bacterium]
MRTIDIHAHLTPQCFWRATEKGGDWHSITRERSARGIETAVVGGERHPLPLRARWKRDHCRWILPTQDEEVVEPE